MNYTSYVADLANLTVTSVTQPDFVAILPTAINYAEERIYRELDLLSTRVRDASTTLTTGSRNFTVPSQFVVVESMNIITPYTAATADAGTRNQMTMVEHDYIDAVWPNSTDLANRGVPNIVASISQEDFIVGPPPDLPYRVEVIGTIRPAPLSAGNTTTFLTDHLPDLFLMASMVFMTGYMKNFGAQGDDPQMAVSWESQYQTAKISAGVEEFRKKWSAANWSSYLPNPIATPPKG